MKLFTTIIFLILNTSLIFAQAGTYNMGATNYNNFINANYQKTFLVEENIIPLFKDWNNNNVIILNDGSKFKLKNINIDLKLNKFAFKNNNKVFFYEFDDLNYIKIERDKYKSIKYKNKNKIVKVLFENSKINFYEGQDVIFRKEGNDPLMIKSDNNYFKKNRYYAVVGNKVLKTKLKKKSLLSMLSKHEKEIILFVKQNKLSYNKLSDVIKIMNYYSTL